MDRLMRQFVVWVCGFALMTWVDKASAVFSAAEQKEIVDLHNKLRASAGASNMQILTWNPTLAIIAQNWSDGCVYAHGQGVNSSTLTGLGLGQNLYAAQPASPVNVSAATILWYNEISNYTYATKTCALGAICGHYTQVVWATTNQIGCGYTVCSSLTPLTWPGSSVFLVCNYAPPGNYLGESPYVAGPACSACPATAPYCDGGLCSATPPTTTAAPTTTVALTTTVAPTTTVALTTTAAAPTTSSPASSCVSLPRDCNDYKILGWNSSGIYPIWLVGSSNPIAVYCDQVTNGGGWTVFQRRKDGSENFIRGWTDYSNGFGNLTGEFWLGNEKVYQMLNASKQYTLRVDLMDFSGVSNWVQYDNFRISSSTDFYKLALLGGFSGSTVYDALTYHVGSSFSTSDKDNDGGPANCASFFRGAWWYNYCYTSNLNGYYYTSPTATNSDGILWLGTYSYSLKFTEMKFRPN